MILYFVYVIDVGDDHLEEPVHLVSALQYICSHLIDGYQWYFLSLPNVYINRERLYQVLQRLKGSQPHILGICLQLFDKIITLDL